MWRKRLGARELRRVVLEEWDPIGVSDAPEAVDEYDSYLGPIADRLRSGASLEQIADYLRRAREGMGLDPDARTDVRASKRIAEWYQASTARFAKLQ
jgi:hypothetical protein